MKTKDIKQAKKVETEFILTPVTLLITQFVLKEKKTDWPDTIR